MNLASIFLTVLNGFDGCLACVKVALYLGGSTKMMNECTMELVGMTAAGLSAVVVGFHFSNPV